MKPEIKDFSGFRRIQDIVSDLSQPVPEEYLDTRRQGGSDLTYISWHDAATLMDQYAPGWGYEIEDVLLLDNVAKPLLGLKVTVYIPAQEGLFARDAIGAKPQENSGYGDPYSNADSMAFRKACAKFGLNRASYEKEDKGDSSQPQQRSSVPQGNRAAPAGNRQAAPAQARQGGGAKGPVAPFGKQKGMPIVDMDDDNLTWLGNAIYESIEDPGKQNFRADNEKLYAAIHAECVKRDLWAAADEAA